MNPEDPKLADALGELSEAVHALNHDRPLRGRFYAEKAYESLTEYTEQRDGTDG